MRIAPAAHLAAAAALLASSCVFVVHDHGDCGECASDWSTSHSTPEHRGSGTPATESREVPEFARIEAGGAIQLDVRIGSPRAVVVQADDNLIGHLRTDVEDGALRLSMRPGSYETRTPMRVEVVTPVLSHLVLDGAAKAKVAGLAGGSLAVDASGAADLELLGRVDLLTAKLSGAAELEGFGLEALRADLEIDGAGEAEVDAREELTADVGGAGKLRYRGEPKRLRTETSGAGTVNAP